MKKSYIYGILGIVVVVIIGAVWVFAKSNAVGTGVTLENNTWQWTTMKETSPAAQSIVPNPGNYTLTFNGDGTFKAKVDCNQVAGTYQIKGNNLTIVLGPTTLAECGPESLYNLFLSKLAIVDSFTFQDAELILRFGGGMGEMTFKPE